MAASMTAQPQSAYPCEFGSEPEVDAEGKRRWRCCRCKQWTGWQPVRVVAVTRKCKVQSEPLGDKVARWLSYVGVTKPRMEAVVGDCGCAERQAMLNQVGWELSDQWQRLLQIPLLALRNPAQPPASVDTRPDQPKPGQKH
jgi:hypothetical protein